MGAVDIGRLLYALCVAFDAELVRWLESLNRVADHIRGEKKHTLEKHAPLEPLM